MLPFRAALCTANNYAAGYGAQHSLSYTPDRDDGGLGPTLRYPPSLRAFMTARSIAELVVYANHSLKHHPEARAGWTGLHGSLRLRLNTLGFKRSNRYETRWPRI